MKFTLSWLKEYLDTDASLDEIVIKLTDIGLEVEEVVDNSETLAAFKVAEIVAAEKHPNADKLQLCKVNNGSEELQIVCGAPNARAGLKVVLAEIGTIIPNGDFKIKKSKIRDVESNGMLCSAAELNLGADSAGIIELDEEAKVGEKAAGYLGGDDPMIEIAITPNRGDCLGVYGIARDLAAAGIGKLKDEGVSTDDFQEIVNDGSFDSDVKVSIENEDNCSYFVGRTIKGVKNGESPAWLKQRLESIGLSPISTLVDITNYITYCFGRPSHVYDVSKLKGDIVVRDSKAGEELEALDGKSYKLEDGMCVIADGSGPVGLGGIIGGEPTGCDEGTTDVFLEVALFDPISIATTGRKLQIESDARYRFERGVSGSTLKHFITLTNLITETCGGEASKPTIAGSISVEPKIVKFAPASVNSLIGIEVSEKEIEKIFTDLGFEVKSKGKEWDVKIPTYRFDISLEADLIEEVARIYGYNNIPALPMPRGDLTEEALNPKQRKIADMRRLLAGRGLSEAVTFSFLSSSVSELFGAANDNKIDNPISSELDAMRPSILPCLLEALAKNEARGAGDIGLFEIGPVFKSASPDGQKISAAGIRAGEKVAKNIHGSPREVDVFDAKADAFSALSGYINPEKLTITTDTPEWYHPGKSGALLLGKQVLGYFGEIHPVVLQQMDIDVSVVAFEIFPENAPEPKAKRSSAFAKLDISNYQVVDRDFAFLVDEKVTAAEILKSVRQAEKNLIVDVNIFDVYQGKGVEEGKKSVALSIRLQPKDKTLTDQEIESVSKKVIDNVTSQVQATLRQ